MEFGINDDGESRGFIISKDEGLLSFRQTGSDVPGKGSQVNGW